MNFSSSKSNNALAEEMESVISEYGIITKCNCCDNYNIYLGQVTLHVNEKQMHSLFYILLKALRLDNNN